MVQGADLIARPDPVRCQGGRTGVSRQSRGSGRRDERTRRLSDAPPDDSRTQVRREAHDSGRLHGKDLVIVGSLAGYDEHPAWVLNLNAHPKCEVQLDFDKYHAVSRDATDAERKALWPSLVKTFPAWGYFQMQTERPFAVKVLTPTGPA